MRWTLYCKCTNFQANHNGHLQHQRALFVGLYIANVLTFKRITTSRGGNAYKNGWTLYCKCTNFQANHNRANVRFSCGGVGLYIANVLTFKRITTTACRTCSAMSWTLYCKCTNFQANHNAASVFTTSWFVGLYIANVLTFKRITTNIPKEVLDAELDSILQMY